MLTINLSPVRSDDQLLIVSLAGTVLTVNKIEYDLAFIPDGAIVENHPVLQNITRTGEDCELTLILPYGANAPYNTRFPMPIKVVVDGEISMPDYDVVTEEK